MIDQRFMNQLADDMREPEEPVQEVMLASGPVTSDMPQTGVRVGRAGITPAQSAKAGGLDRPLVALLDTLAGALQGATAQTLGLPGDIRSIIDMIAQEGATKYLGERTMPTTTEMQQKLPAVIPQGVANQAEREYTAKVASDIGTFLPAPGLLDAPKVIKGAVQATKNMPVGMSTQMVGEGVSDLGFYSAAKQAVDSIQQPKGTGEQFLKQIEKTPGVKPEEIKWTGLDDFLKSKKTVTKAEVQEYLDKNRVEVKEVQLGGGYATIEKELNKQGYELNVDMDGDWSIFKNNEYVELDELPADLQKFVMENSPGKTETKFSKYTLPGGENYREILLTLPAKPDVVRQMADGSWIVQGTEGSEGFYGKTKEEAIERFRSGRASSKEFSSQHFDQKNILAHMRVNDRVDADGKKVLFVEEVQSDWHQAGRKKGYNTPEQRAKDQQRLDALDAERKTLEAEKARLETLAEPFTNQGKDAPADILDQWNMTANRLNNLQREYAPIANQLATGGSTVPDAPFKTTWHELALKRAIQVAAEGGYDRIAFTTGKTQAERYDLSKQIGQINARPTPDGKISLEALTPDMGEQVIQRVVMADELDDIVGKEIADKIRTQIEYPKNFDDRGKSVELSGLDLKVGGEGMKGFYDQILPKFLDKYAKKWDAKVGMTDIQAGTTANKSFTEALNKSEFANEYKTASDKRKSEIVDIITERMKKENVAVQYIDITPKMKESVLTKGQPLFAIGAGGAAVQQEENE
jgi:hypothetical protein